ncbi:uncharacterized protein LOC113850697 [Abrus precatorius]|uniref:Uncharacterized protein LOC113850697 n=1 Tax=Abrus precatorius TaxID=3816 RepID=A0A8B8K0R5_ABRPR|nr:uncharacterized protein LOC113850697 [Abrus precatorius]
MECREEHKMVYATYMLGGEAEDWWRFTNYVAFHELIKYWPHFQYENGDEDLCAQFENGLRPEIRAAVNVFQVADLPTLSQSRGTAFRGGSSSGSNLSRGLLRCGGPHLVRNHNHHRLMSGSVSGSNRPTSRASSGEKLNVQGNVFAMSGSKASKSDELIRDKCIINRFCDVLFDSGATHFFVSMDCVSCVGLPISSLRCNVIVSTPTTKPVVTSYVCLGCSITVHGRNFSVDLICLPLSQLDVVLGMDYLLSNRVIPSRWTFKRVTGREVTTDSGDRYLGFDDDLNSEDLIEIESWHGID